ncbi:IPExxxVDY family protein [Sphingobacterium sp. DK4209]|uniref:IPExxxVDY family protein n=1 Tax=Sphingobacterium zhuxiongii TaxID=2662364 RepID=A0A5Q0QF69_9SPHI|nr:MULTISPECIES: IPExxxVDY family protein [unclassified Sphingobacterium]MVZ67664.1 IPExxxVDY family protein [Sphingobacterium sp. DK4209]QGA27611.1 IPExxxVDY family protein [Sphingobacterium sp. dk4302]
MSKITFKLETDFDLELDFILIGLSSVLRDYRLCHFINKHTGLKLVHGKEDYIDHNGNKKDKPQNELDYHIIFETKKNKPSTQHHFITYRYNNQTYDFEFYLLSNKSIEGGTLIPEIVSFDYFLLIKHYIDEEDLEALIDNLKSIPEVLLVKEIDPTVLKSKENLIF